MQSPAGVRPALVSTRSHLSLRGERVGRGWAGALHGLGASRLLLGFLSRGDKCTDQALLTMAEDQQQPKSPGTDEELWARSPSGTWTRCGPESGRETLS